MKRGPSAPRRSIRRGGAEHSAARHQPDLRDALHELHGHAVAPWPRLTFDPDWIASNRLEHQADKPIEKGGLRHSAGAMRRWPPARIV
jgi:hypothetical protein